ncbi:DNA topoisomerase IV subunit A [Paucibacter soli]|uniref:DNA topoisomerase IV subunit A n=1 Tax=Paucibacter soli TaxID=3133433 RepID=UPI0030B07F62
MTLETSLQAPPSDHAVTIHEHAEDAYLQYAVSTVKNRALPDVEDGNKPVHRRVLYAMHALGLDARSKKVKSARIIGEVLGKFHPHGDQAAYDAMVRLAQPFSLRYPLIDGQGNFGSLDGDTAAAMRYTEARLAPIADLLLNELGQGTVDFTDNYDGSQQEPLLLPARLPFMLLNGGFGIAVSMASDCPPHNLREVADAAALVVANPAASLDDVLKHILGPDFPGGGQLISTPEEIREAYATGRTPLRCRARWTREDLARSQWQMVINELPYQVSTRMILEEIEELTNPKIKAGKKTLTQQQLNLKQIALEFLDKVTDESDKDNAIRLVFIPRTSKVDFDQMMAFLLANTSLEVSVSFNMNMIGLDGRPQTKGLLPVLTEWAQFRVDTVRRRTQFELDGALRRIHILEGRMVVYLNLDAVIKIVRFSDDPKLELMKTFSLSEIQANDILDMRLRQLNNLEGIKIERELDELRTLAARLQTLLANDTELRGLVVSEIRADASRFGDDRRTVIQVAERVTASSASVRNVPDEEITLVISKNLWVKAYKGHGLDQAAFAFKTGDGLQFAVETRTVGSVYLLDSKGRAYQMDPSQAPTGRGDGLPLTTFIEQQAGAKIAAALTGPEEKKYLFGGDMGYGFVSPLKSLASKQRAGKAFLTLQDGENPIPPVALPEKTDTGSWPGYIACGSTDGRMLAFVPDEVKELPGGKGVMLMILEDDQRLSVVRHCDGAPFVGKVKLAGKELDIKLAGHDWEKHVGHRARKGAQTPKKGVLL